MSRRCSACLDYSDIIFKRHSFRKGYCIHCPAWHTPYSAPIQRCAGLTRNVQVHAEQKTVPGVWAKPYQDKSNYMADQISAYLDECGVTNTQLQALVCRRDLVGAQVHSWQQVFWGGGYDCTQRIDLHGRSYLHQLQQQQHCCHYA